MSQNINILVAFSAGFLSFFSPCLFPLLPGFISLLAGESTEQKPLKLLPAIILFVLGFTTVFSILGLSASFMGAILLRYRPVIAQVSGIFIIIFGLAIMKVINIPFLMQEKRPIAYKGSSFTVGIAFGFGWSPCIGLVLSSILLIAGSSGSITKGILLLFAFCLGLGIAFIIFGMLFTYALSTFDFIKRYNRYIYTASGVILVLTGVILASGKFFYYASWLRSLFV